MKIRKDCDEVFPQIMVGTGDCIKDVSFVVVVSLAIFNKGMTRVIKTFETNVLVKSFLHIYTFFLGPALGNLPKVNKYTFKL